MFEEVAKVLAEQLNLNVSDVTAEKDIIKDLGADSLDVVEMLMTLEDRTAKTIPQQKFADLKTVGDVFKIIQTI